jgi:putative transposase
VGCFNPVGVPCVPARHIHLSLQISSPRTGWPRTAHPRDLPNARALRLWRVHIQLRREGWCHGQNKTRRIYRELGLQLRNKTPKRRVKAKLREDRRPATRSNETWAMDFVHDQLATGRKLRVLTIVDTFSRFSPALEPRFTFRGADVVEVLERVGRQVGFLATIRVDQATEFVSRDLDLRAYPRGVR